MILVLKNVLVAFGSSLTNKKLSFFCYQMIKTQYLYLALLKTEFGKPVPLDENSETKSAAKTLCKTLPQCIIQFIPLCGL